MFLTGDACTMLDLMVVYWLARFACILSRNGEDLVIAKDFFIVLSFEDEPF